MSPQTSISRIASLQSIVRFIQHRYIHHSYRLFDKHGRVPRKPETIPYGVIGVLVLIIPSVILGSYIGNKYAAYYPEKSDGANEIQNTERLCEKKELSLQTEELNREMRIENDYIIPEPLLQQKQKQTKKVKEVYFELVGSDEFPCFIKRSTTK